jgi:uncharacterized protein YdaT
MEMKDESYFDSLEEAKKAIRNAYADLVGYFIYEGYREDAFIRAMSIVAEECNTSKNEIVRLIKENL